MKDKAKVRMYVFTDKHCPNEQCNAQVSLLQLVEMSESYEAHSMIKLMGDPICETCHPVGLEDGVPLSKSPVDLIGPGEREMWLIEAIRYIKEDEVDLTDYIAAAVENHARDRKKHREKALSEIIKNPHCLTVALSEWS